MKIKSFKYFHFEICLKKPFENSGGIISSRKGMIVEVIDDSDNRAYGEVNPLPGYSKETIDKISAKLDEIKQLLSDNELDSDLFQSIDELPSLKFGISQALHSIFILRNGFDSQQNYNSDLKVNGVVGLLPKFQSVSEVERLINKGYRTIKIKVGRDSIDDDVEIIKTLSDNFSDSIRLRLDANGKWNTEQAAFIDKELKNLSIEYIEQPVRKLEDLIKVSERSNIPIAIDEAIDNFDIIPDLIKSSKIQYFCLKPSIMGAMNEIISTIKLIESNNRIAIISSAFESVVGRSALVYLASLISGKSAHGLAVAEHFQNDIAEDAFSVQNGQIKFNERNYPPNFRIIKS